MSSMVRTTSRSAPRPGGCVIVGFERTIGLIQAAGRQAVERDTLYDVVGAAG